MSDIEGTRSGSSLSLILCRNEPQKNNKQGESSRSLHASTTSDIHVPLLPHQTVVSIVMEHSLTRSQAPDSWKSRLGSFFRPFFNEIPKCWEIKSLNCIIHSPTCFLIDAHTQKRELWIRKKEGFESPVFRQQPYVVSKWNVGVKKKVAPTKHSH